MSVTQGKVRKTVMAMLASLLFLAGCGFDPGELISEKIKEQTGEDIGITLGAGPTCMPDWVNYPDDDSANNGMKVPGGEVCVSSWFIDEDSGFDANQRLPEVADEAMFAQLADGLLPLLLSQIPGPARDALNRSSDFKELSDELSLMDIIFRVYGEGQRVILVLIAPGEEIADYQLVIGAFCEGNC